jgi:hypothetical protein
MAGVAVTLASGLGLSALFVVNDLPIIIVLFTRDKY